MAFSMEGRFPLASKNYMKYCLSINSDYKFGKEISQTKLPIKKSYNKLIPEYILSKSKTGWSVPITDWLQKNKNIKTACLNTFNKNDGIKEILSEENYIGNPKRIIITWLIRSWAQQYKMSL